MKRIFLLGALIAAIAYPASAAAHGTGVPAHQIGSVACAPGSVRAWPPRQMLSVNQVTFRDAERVHWVPQLYRWNDVYQTWDYWAGWTSYRYTAFTSIFGYYQYPGGVWLDEATQNRGLMFVPFNGLPSGYYAIKNWMLWDATGWQHVEFSNYCYVD
jgi:hypothetical protein